MIDYAASGVRPDFAAQLLQKFRKFQKTRPRSPYVVEGIGPFAACLRLDAFAPGSFLVTTCDGVGTKAKLAVEWGKVSGLGADLVAMNTNDLLCLGARPLFFLDYYACGKLREQHYLPILKSIQKACEVAEMALVGGETAEMPGVYQEQDVDLAGFAVGSVAPQQRLGPHRVRRWDRLIAFASTGFHANGYSLLRTLIAKEGLDPNRRAPFGRASWRQVFLSPTRIYGPWLLPELKSFHALCHITGGGLFENLPRVLPPHLDAEVLASRWPLPPAFAWAGEVSGLDTKGLLGVLNGGVGMIGVVPPQEGKSLIARCQKKGLKAWEIGRIVTGAGRVQWVV